jgi:hypothetical protein
LDPTTGAQMLFQARCVLLNTELGKYTWPVRRHTLSP